MTTHSSILAWKIPWTEEPGRLYMIRGVAESDMTEATSPSLFSLFCHCQLLSSSREYHAKARESLLFSYSLTHLRRRQWQPTPVLLHRKSHGRGRRSLVGYSPWGLKESDTTEQLHFHFSLSCIGEGNGNPLQYYCLENPRDRGAWWAAVYGVSQSRTRLMQLSSSSRSKSFKEILFFLKWSNFKKKLSNSTGGSQEWCSSTELWGRGDST